MYNNISVKSMGFIKIYILFRAMKVGVRGEGLTTKEPLLQFVEEHGWISEGWGPG